MTSKKLYRSKTNKKLFGVCGGIAEYFNVDVTLIRLGVAVATVLTSYIGLGFVLYLLCAFILPTEEDNKVS